MYSLTENLAVWWRAYHQISCLYQTSTRWRAKDAGKVLGAFITELKLRSTSSAKKNFANETWKTEQNLGIWPSLNSLPDFWVRESGRKIDPATGVTYHKSEKDCRLLLIFMDYCRDIQIISLLWFGMGLFLWISLMCYSFRCGKKQNENQCSKKNVRNFDFGIATY